MQKTLTTTALIFAGISGLMAASEMSNIDHKNGDYTYTLSFQKWNSDMTKKGQNDVTGVSNYSWNGLYVNLKEDARYELTFHIYTSAANPTGNVIPMFNFYFAAPNNSLLFGNYFDVPNIGNRGIAGIFHHGGNASDGDLVNSASATYILNKYLSKDASGVVNWKQSTRKDVAMNSPSVLSAGYHEYKIYIESFADSSKADLIKFMYVGQDGSGWTTEHDISVIGGGISRDRDGIVVGYYSDPDGGTLTVDQAMFAKYSRVEKTVEVIPPAPEPETPPAVNPSVPEPSAFGLLAGLGAIALAASRRRRSR